MDLVVPLKGYPHPHPSDLDQHTCCAVAAVAPTEEVPPFTTAARATATTMKRPYVATLSQRQQPHQMVSAPCALYGFHRAQHLRVGAPSVLVLSRVPPAPVQGHTAGPHHAAAASQGMPPEPDHAFTGGGSFVWVHQAAPRHAAAQHGSGSAADGVRPSAVYGSLPAQELEQLRTRQSGSGAGGDAGRQRQAAAPAHAAVRSLPPAAAPAAMPVLYRDARARYLRLAQQQQQQSEACPAAGEAPRPGLTTPSASDASDAAALGGAACGGCCGTGSSGGSSLDSTATLQTVFALECDEVLSGPCAVTGAGAPTEAAAAAAHASAAVAVAAPPVWPRQGSRDPDTAALEAWWWHGGDERGVGTEAGGRGAASLCCLGPRGACGVRCASDSVLCARAMLVSEAPAANALAVANALMSSTVLPDGVKYLPLQQGSFLFQLSTQWQFPAYAVALGSSYFQRLLKSMPALQAAARGLSEFACYQPSLTCTCGVHWGVCRGAHAPACPCAVAVAADPGHPLPAGAAGFSAIPNPQLTLRCIQFTCVYLACKVVDQVHATGLLRYMLGALTGGASHFSLQQAAAVEARCLEGLRWRLGPWFEHDGLAQDDHGQLRTAVCV